MGDLDQSLRRIAQLFPVEWVHFVLSDDTARYLGPAQIELANEPPLQMDTLFRVEVDGDVCLIDLEAQAEADKKMGWRLYKYAARASLTLVRRWVMSNDLLESSPLYQVWKQEWLEKNRDKWEEEGREQGREQGRVVGREEGMREAILTVLQGRFGALPPDVEQAINRADHTALEAFLPYINDESLEQLRARLGV